VSPNIPENLSVTISNDLAEALLLNCAGGRHDYFTLLGVSARQTTPEDVAYASRSIERELRQLLFDRELGTEAKAFKEDLRKITEKLATTGGIADYRNQVSASPQREQIDLLREFEAEVSQLVDDSEPHELPGVLKALRSKAKSMGLKENFSESLLRRFEEELPLAPTNEPERPSPPPSPSTSQPVQRREEEEVKPFPGSSLNISLGQSSEPSSGDGGLQGIFSDDVPASSGDWKGLADTGQQDATPTFPPSYDGKPAELDLGGLGSSPAPSNDPLGISDFEISAPDSSAPSSSDESDNMANDLSAALATASQDLIERQKLTPAMIGALKAAGKQLKKSVPSNRTSELLGVVTYPGYFPIFGKTAEESRHLLIQSLEGDFDPESSRVGAAPAPVKGVNTKPDFGGLVGTEAGTPSVKPAVSPSLKTTVDTVPSGKVDNGDGPLVPGSHPDEKADAAAPKVFIHPSLLRSVEEAAAEEEENPREFETIHERKKTSFWAEHGVLVTVFLLIIGMVFGGGYFYLNHMVSPTARRPHSNIGTVGSGATGGSSSGSSTSGGQQVALNTSGGSSSSGGSSGSGGSNFSGGSSSTSSGNTTGGSGATNFSSDPPGGSGGNESIADIEAGFSEDVRALLEQNVDLSYPDRMIAFEAGFLGPHFFEEFEIRAFEVTNAEYEQFVRATGHPAPVHWPDGKVDYSIATLPVTNVGYRDVQLYVEWLTRSHSLEGEHYDIPSYEHYQGLMYPRLALGNRAIININAPQNASRPGEDVVELDEGAIFNLFGNVAEWARSPKGTNGAIAGRAYTDTAYSAQSLVRPAPSSQTSNASVGFRYIKISDK
jgi:hypothetical protein